MFEYFNDLKIYPYSQNQILHNIVTIRWYSLCELLNLDYIKTKMLTYSK